MIILEVALTAGLFCVSLLLFVMVRQVGVIAQRIPKSTDPHALNPLPVGTLIPITEFATYDRRSRVTFAPDAPRAGAIFVFASFNCPICSLVLQQLHETPDEVRRRVILFLLDTDVARRFASRIKANKLAGIPMVEAYDFADQFRIHRAPFVYVVDPMGTILEATAIVAATDLSMLYRKYFRRLIPAEQEKRDVDYATPIQSNRQPGEPARNVDGEKVYSP